MIIKASSTQSFYAAEIGQTVEFVRDRVRHRGTVMDIDRRHPTAPAIVYVAVQGCRFMFAIDEGDTLPESKPHYDVGLSKVVVL
jgi:hypothetical protein